MRVAAVAAAVAVGATVGWAQTLGGSRYIRLEWEVSQGQRPIVSGYLYNDYALPAVRVQLLVEAVDASGRTLTATVVYVDAEVPPKGRAYFEASVPRAGATYRITVNYVEWSPSG